MRRSPTPTPPARSGRSAGERGATREKENVKRKSRGRRKTKKENEIAQVFAFHRGADRVLLAVGFAACAAQGASVPLIMPGIFSDAMTYLGEARCCVFVNDVCFMFVSFVSVSLFRRVLSDLSWSGLASSLFGNQEPERRCHPTMRAAAPSS